MEEIKTLRPEGEVIKDIIGRSKLIVADIDYTLTDFEVGHTAGILSLVPLLGQEIVQTIDDSFHLILDGHRFKDKDHWERRNDFNKLMIDVEKLQTDSTMQYGVKVWSREAWIILAARKMGRTLTFEEIELARDRYWSSLTKNLSIYPDAKEFLTFIQEKNLPLILFTGSDSVMQVIDSSEGPRLKYDPEFSRMKKVERLKGLPIQYNDLVIGDPIDKPNPLYFDEVEKSISSFGEFNHSEVTFIGDSPKNDLQVPTERGYRTVFIHRL